MKLRWHLLSLLVASIAMGLFWSWPRGPVWQLQDERTVRSAGVDLVRNEWHTLVCDTNKSNWRLETRSGIDSQVIRSVPLAIPAVKGITQSTNRGKQVSPEAPIVFVDHWNESQPGGGLKVEERIWLLDSQTGQLLSQEPFILRGMGSVTQHRDRVAIGGAEQVWLLEGKTAQARTVPIKNPGNLKFSLDGRWLACTDYESLLCFIDWKTGKVVRPLGFTKQVYSLGFITHDTVVLSMSVLAGQEISRWRWDGEMLHQLSPGIVLSSNMWPLLHKSHPNGLLHVCVNTNEDWPLHLKPLLVWLEEHHVPISRWFPREHGFHWHALDDKDRIVREYHEPIESKGIQLNQQYAVEIRRVDQSSATIVALWNTSPVWPNALALCMVIYLLLYVFARCMKHQVVIQ
ncbi:MAG: hypothetical protein QM703_01990 [Gemmatales bacterium]